MEIQYMPVAVGPQFNRGTTKKPMYQEGEFQMCSFTDRQLKENYWLSAPLLAFLMMMYLLLSSTKMHTS